jgi:hypothetical protein
VSDRLKLAICAALLTALACMYGIGVSAPGVGFSHDDGIYLVTAKALATGQGYRIISLPDRLAQTKYPPLFPALLAVVWKIYPEFPANVPVLKLVPLLAGVIWLWLAYKLLVGEGMSKPGALGAITLTAGTGWVFFLGTTLFSDTLFAALSTGALLMLRRIERRGASALYVAMTGAAIGLTLLTRTSGLALLAAGVLMLAHKGRLRHAILLGVVAAALYAPWIWWTSVHPGPGQRMYAYYTAENYRAWNIVFGFGPSEKLSVAWGNLIHLAGSPLTLLEAPYGLWVCLLVPAGIGMGYGLIRALAGGRSMTIPVFLICYFGLLVLWAWPPERFVATVFPLVLFLFWVAGENIRGTAWLRWSVRVAALVAIAYLGEARYGVCRQVISNGAYTNYNWTALGAMTAWIQRSTPADAVLVSGLDPSIYLCTGRKALRGFDLNPVALFYKVDEERNPAIQPAETIREIVESHATYLVSTPVHGGSDILALNRAIAEMLRAKPNAFRPAYRGPAEYAVYEIDRQALNQR